MISLAIIIGIIGILLFLAILATYSKLLKNNESGFLHLLMCLMYTCWLPLPIVINFKYKASDFLIIGTIFGTTSILFLIINMLLQASHLSYSALKSNNNSDLWNDRDAWILNGLLGGQVEIFAFFLKTLWYICLTYVFFINNNCIFFSIGIIYSFLVVFYFFMLIDKSLVKTTPFLANFKLNTLIINLETVSWFLFIIIFLVIT